VMPHITICIRKHLFEALPSHDYGGVYKHPLVIYTHFLTAKVTVKLLIIEVDW
jgi:hypothetical protein